MIRCLLVCWATTALAADAPLLTAKVETLEPPKELAMLVRATLSDRALVVRDAKGVSCTFWLRKEIPAQATAEQRSAGLTYRAMAPTTLIAVVQFARSWVDFHQQEADAGVYTLRLAIQPNTKDHEGTAPHPEFCILAPAAKDTKPDLLPIKTLIGHSGTITGGTHPVVMQLYPPSKAEVVPMMARRGKAGQTLNTTLNLFVDGKAYPIGIAFNLVGTGTDE